MTFFLSQAFGRQESRRSFESAEAIKRSIVRSKKYEIDQTKPENAYALLIFSTSNQQTWLVASKKRVYCILDDAREPVPSVQWSESLDDLMDATGQPSIEITVRPKNEKTGLIDIGPKHRDWLFSHKLFGVSSIKEEIDKLLKVASEHAG